MNPVVNINEPITVKMLFGEPSKGYGSARPLEIIWHNREILITALGLHHIARHNGHLIHVFDVSDGQNNYRLEFDSNQLTWKLESMIDGASL